MRELPKWYKKRGYAHFDTAPHPDGVIALATDPKRVAKYPFWPFLTYVKTTARRQAVVDAAGTKTKKRTKGVAKERPITYAAHLDSHIFAKYASDLGAALEQHEYTGQPFASSVLAYRRHTPRKNNIHFAADAFRDIQERGECDAVAVDLEAFFDSLDHERLRLLWCRVVQSGTRLPPDHYAVFRAVSERRRVDRKQLRTILGRDVPRGRLPGNRRVCTPAEFRSKVREHVSKPEPRGIPQGSPISAVLANLYMLDVDRDLSAGLAARGASYRRYSDDILVVCGPGEAHAVEQLVTAAVENVGLSIKPAKTLRIAFRRCASGLESTEIPAPGGEDGGAGAYDTTPTEQLKPRSLAYLGFEWDGRAMRIRSQTLARFLKKMKRNVNAARLAAEKRHELRLRRAKLYRRFSFLGWNPRANPKDRPAPSGERRHGNFIDYANLGVTISGSEVMRRQIGKQWQRLHDEIGKAEDILELRAPEPALARQLATKRRKPRRGRGIDSRSTAM